MAKYLVTSGSYFEPFTYEQLSAPVREMAEMHRASQDTYDQISLEAEALRRYIEREPDNSEARRMYDSYMDKLTNLQNNLWSNGYNAQTRRDLSAARAGYASDISRLGTAIQTRQQRSAEYWKTRHDHPDMIMGNDPGLAGLDSYLSDDLYGQNYYTYSGKDFMNQVATDAKARAGELLMKPEISRDPRAVGYLERIKRDGFTSIEVQQASDAVDRYLAGDKSALVNLDMPQSILANVLVSNLESTGAVPGESGNVSKEEYRRLVNYGKAGLSQAIGKTDIDYMKDLEWQANEDRALARYKKSLEDPQPPTTTTMHDTWTEPVVGSKAPSERRRTSRKLGTRTLLGDKEEKLLVGPDGVETYNAVDSSQAVYSEELRREASEVLGFDIGVDPDTNGIIPDLFLSQKKFLYGQTVDDNGVLYDTRYNPKINKVQVRRAGTDEQWGVDDDLTDYYDRKRKEFLDVEREYKENYPEIYKRAKVNPNKQRRMYSNDDIAGFLPLDKYQEAVMGRSAETGIADYTSSVVFTEGKDPGENLAKIGTALYNAFDTDKNGNLKAPDNWRAYNGKPGYVHEISKDGVVKPEAVSNPEKIFTTKDGVVTNIAAITIDPSAINNGYIIVHTGGSSKYAVSYSMFKSDRLKTIFLNAQQQLEALYRQPAVTEEQIKKKVADLNTIVNNTNTALRHFFGFDDVATSATNGSPVDKLYGGK